MTSKKSRVVTIEMLNDAARDYTELRRSLEGLAKSVDDAYDRLQVLLKRASATTVKAYLVGSVHKMHRIPNPNLEKRTTAEK